MARHNLQFSVLDSDNSSLIVINDESSYMQPPQLPTLYVRFPGFTEWCSLFITPSKVNNISTKQLKYEAAEFPDGVYEIKYTISPSDKYSITHYYVRDVKFKKEFLSYLEKIGENQHLSIDNAWEIELYLQASKAAAINNKLTQAVTFFKEAQNKLSKLTCE
jgi:hypothetical protein